MITFLWMLYLAFTIAFSFVSINNHLTAIYERTQNKRSDALGILICSILWSILWSIWYFYHLH